MPVPGKWRGSFVTQNRRQNIDGVRTGERQTARDHLVNQNPEAEDVRAGVYLKSAGLLRRHVDGRSHYHPGFSFDGS